jgi:glycosyltransferase involved in cell wall biosynthesis
VLQRWVDRRVTGYFFTTAGLAESWIETGLIDQLKIFEVMEASSAFHPTDRIEARQKTGVTGTKTYLWVGRLDRNKDPLTLIHAFRTFLHEHEEARLYMIYQQDDLLGEVKSSLTAHDQHIILAGKVDHDQLLHWFNSVDFIVSTSHYEGSGIAVCEAMSCGCIPVLSDIPSFRKMTDNGNVGLLFTAGDNTSLEAALERSVSLPIDIHRKKVLDQFNGALSFEAIARKMRQVLSQSLSNGNG